MLTAPVLQLDAARMHEIDPRNVEMLFGMWSVFSRCSTTIVEGKRLENLSWRVWARETLCCPPQPEKAIVPAIDISPSRSSGVPSLSTSVESSDSLNALSFSARKERARKLSESEDSALSKSRGKEPHLTSHTLEKIVTIIQEKPELGPLSPRIEAVVNAKIQPDVSLLTKSNSAEVPPSRALPFSTESSCISSITAETDNTARKSDHRDSETSVSSTDGDGVIRSDGDGIIRSGSVVHGFSPAASSFRSSHARLSQGPSSLLPSLHPAQAKALQAPTKKGGMFTLGASSEDESSLDSRMSPYRRPLSDLRTSSLSKTIANKGLAQKQPTSFKAIVEQHRLQKQKEGGNEDEGAIASSDEDEDEDEDDVADSAIEEDDDDEGEWESSHSDDGRDSREHVFKRIDSRPNLTSRRSVLTQGLNEKDRASGLVNAASKTPPALRRARGTSHNGPSMPGSPEENEEEESGMMMQRSKGSKPLPIISTTPNTYAMAHSPRTTRRNMLSTELTQSLRQNLLWERQQKNTTVNAFIKRQAQSMANLPRMNQSAQTLPNPSGLANVSKPSIPSIPTKEPNVETVAKNNNSWNHYFDNPWEYHAKGW